MTATPRSPARSRWRRAAAATITATTVALSVAACYPPPAGTDFLVFVTADGHDSAPGDGACRSPEAGNACTLRAAVEEAEANGWINEVIYVAPGTYPLPLGDLRITTSMFVFGAGADETFIEPGYHHRAFSVGNAAGADPVTTISRLTISGAVLPSTRAGGAGGAVLVREKASLNLFDVVIAGNRSGVAGGGIYNAGRLDLRRSEVRDNTIGGGATIGGGVTSTGGGIYNIGNLKVREATIAGNESSRGGGIANVGGDVDLVNSTISGNVVFEGGGGIYNTSVPGQPPGTAVFNIASSTITQNHAFVTGSATVRPWGGGILNLTGGQINIGKSVVAGNTDNRSTSSDHYSPDCHSVQAHRFTSHRANLVGILTDNCVLRDTIFGGTGGITFGTPGDPLDARLGPLGSNGGTTRTHVPAPNSPLIDTATSGSSSSFFDCPPADQRGRARPLDGDGDREPDCDIGAVERPMADDGDGVPAAVEDGAPGGGDGNADGIPDRYQAKVASVPALAPGSGYVTFVVSGDGEYFENIAPVAVPDPTAAPPRLFDIGFWDMDVVPGGDGEVRVTVLLPSGTTAVQWWLHGPEPGDGSDHWWQFALSGGTGLAGMGATLLLDFADGERGDADARANGHVTSVGGAGRSLYCGMQVATIIGTAAGETIDGTPGDDVIVGRGGADTINGFGGNDVICGNPGADTLHGGAGNDVLYGGKGADEIHGGPGDDILYGNAGNDALGGGPGYDILRGGPGGDATYNGEDVID